MMVERRCIGLDQEELDKVDKNKYIEFVEKEFPPFLCDNLEKEFIENTHEVWRFICGHIYTKERIGLPWLKGPRGNAVAFCGEFTNKKTKQDIENIFYKYFNPLLKDGENIKLKDLDVILEEY